MVPAVRAWPRPLVRQLLLVLRPRLRPQLQSLVPLICLEAEQQELVMTQLLRFFLVLLLPLALLLPGLMALEVAQALLQLAL